MIECLIAAVFFEARDQPVQGQFAVAEVVMNRVESDRCDCKLALYGLVPSLKEYCCNQTLNHLLTSDTCVDVYCRLA